MMITCSFVVNQYISGPPISYCAEVGKFQFKIRPCCISSCDEEDAAAGDGDDVGKGDDDVGDGYGGGDDYWYDNGDHGNSEIIMMTIGITIMHILFC